jgi:hypothetical protein
VSETQETKCERNPKFEKRTNMTTENNNFVQPAIPRFDGHYDHWSMLMENLLRSKEYWSLVESGIPTVAAGVQPTEQQSKAIEKQS